MGNYMYVNGLITKAGRDKSHQQAQARLAPRQPVNPLKKQITQTLMQKFEATGVPARSAKRQPINSKRQREKEIHVNKRKIHWETSKIKQNNNETDAET